MKMLDLIINYDGRKAEIKLPCDENDLSTALAKIGANENNVEQFIDEVKWPTELKVFENKFLNLDELNYLAKRMASFDKQELDKFYAVVAQENKNNLKAMINLTFNLRSYTLIQDMRDIEAVGRNHFLTTRVCASTSEMERTDFKKIGQELLNSGKGLLTEKGVLYKNEDIPQQEFYDGQVFPQYSFNGSELLCVGIEYDGKEEFVYLPDEPISIKKALKRLGAAHADDCAMSLDYFNYEDADWRRKFEEMLIKEDIFEINLLSGELNSADMDLDKLKTVIKYALSKNTELNETAEVISKLARHINDFNVLEKVDDLTEVGQKIIEESYEYSLSPELEEYFNFEAFATDYSTTYDGEFIDGNFVYMEDCATLDDILSDDLNLKLS